MRFLFGFICVLALSVMGCHEDDITYCESDSDCPDDGDGNECTFGRCLTVGFCGYHAVADGKTCSDGVCLRRTCTALTSVSGTVTLIDSDTESPAADAEVSWFGTSFSTTTDTLGEFSLELPFGTVVLHASRDGAWSGVELGTVSDAGLVNPDIEILADAVVAQVAGDLMMEIDEEKGIVSVDFEPESVVVGGETATILLPQAPHDFAFTSDAGGNWVVSDQLLAAGSRTLSFAGVGYENQLVVDPVGVEGVNTCGLAVENPTVIGIDIPVRPKTVTRVQALCAPIP
ncbi:MAG: hypothetical protein JRH14_14015 [Deltaproteobacteria bacterium]|nr:hypothetical protein [Deltaproteobacteria bacterium]MBW2161051.1 hypothetical protein [Deltaproteobacteria bacterium]